MEDASAEGSDDADLVRRKRAARTLAKVDRAGIEIDDAMYCSTLAHFLDSTVPARRWIVVYLAMGDEVDLSALVAAQPDPGSRYAVTRTPDEGLTLTVHPWGEPQERHRFGYSQPRIDSRQLTYTDIGAVLVPGLAFDRQGRRLGRGKGYYDRFLARLDGECLRIGITGDYDPPDVPTGRFDVLMTHLAYSGGVVPVNPERRC